MFRNLIIINILFAVMLWVFTSIASANDNTKSDEYYKAVIGHVVTQKVTGQNINTNKLMEQEMEAIAHQFALQMIVIMQKYLPSMLDGIAADLRLKSDEKYKCALLKGSANGCVQ